ncbi:MAG: YtxH domain-containing protein [Chloroflexota bacterium]|nr:YtxH domain-containing protein [Chloroflexota bacterium]
MARSNKSKELRDEIVIVREDPSSGWISGLLLGVAIGAAVGLFRAPRAGKELRQTLTQRVSSAGQTARSKLPSRASSSSQ